MYKVQKYAIQYRVYKVHNVRYNIQIPAIKHDKIQYHETKMGLWRGEGYWK